MELKIYANNREIKIDDVLSCTKIAKPDNIDYAFGDSSTVEYNYFKIIFNNGKEKNLAVAGKVESYDIPANKTIQDTWEEIKK